MSGMESLFNRELLVRSFSAFLLVLVTLIAIYYGGFVLLGFLLLVSFQMAREWNKISLHDGLIWKLAGILYITLPVIALLWIRETSLVAALFLLILVWATDVGAYVFGRLIGGPKLAPAISPGKTIAGFIGGIGTVVALDALYVYQQESMGIVRLIIVTLILSVLSQAGDLLESWMKRRKQLKDTGNLIPGHGGVLDRVDGIIFTAPVLALMMMTHIADFD